MNRQKKSSFLAQFVLTHTHTNTSIRDRQILTLMWARHCECVQLQLRNSHDTFMWCDEIERFEFKRFRLKISRRHRTLYVGHARNFRNEIQGPLQNLLGITIWDLIQMKYTLLETSFVNLLFNFVQLWNCAFANLDRNESTGLVCRPWQPFPNILAPKHSFWWFKCVYNNYIVFTSKKRTRGDCTGDDNLLAGDHELR